MRARRAIGSEAVKDPAPLHPSLSHTLQCFSCLLIPAEGYSDAARCRARQVCSGFRGLASRHVRTVVPDSAIKIL